jgi:hypothetical protein
MRLTKIYVRFYKSFNYDYERKFARTSEPDPWEVLDNTWYPYVRLEVEPSITTIVGANESGKSHLLDSIEKLITGESIGRSDFCRYSQFFSVEAGQRRSPDFGGEFEVANDDDVALAKEYLGLDLKPGSRFHLFRPNGERPIAYMPGQSTPISIDKPQADLVRALPAVFRLDANVPLPASIPLYELAPDARRSSGSRQSRWTVMEHILGKHWPNSDEFTKAAPSLFGLLSGRTLESKYADELGKQYELGRDLLFRVARIDQTTF